MNLKVRQPFVIVSKIFLFRDVLYIYQHIASDYQPNNKAIFQWFWTATVFNQF